MKFQTLSSAKFCINEIKWVYNILKAVYFCFLGHFRIASDAVLLNNYCVPVIFKVISYIIFNSIEVHIN